MNQSTYDTVGEAQAQYAAERKARTPRERMIHDRRMDIGMVIVDLQHADAKLQYSDDPAQAVRLCNQGAQHLMVAISRLTNQVLTDAERPSAKTEVAA